MRVFIVDDEAPARSRLRVLLTDIAPHFPNVVTGEAENGAQALERLAAEAADAVLVDIRMPVMDGIELARHLPRLPLPPAVVFVTAYDQYAVRAFELNAVDYLLKPVRAQRLKDALEKAQRGAVPVEVMRELAPEGRQYLSCSERGRILLVPVAEVLYLRAELKYVTARTRERDYLIEESLVALEQEFPQRFVRVHRNCLVARRAISGFERAQGEEAESHWLVLLNGLAEKLPVSRRQWPALKGSLAAAARAER
ncbi:MAG TPA: LytTR family DNA-binding domain-containing protein [Rhodocyclaceae bacterium]|nr:LytTR family DNA-binding domain-containing protein [Rhodocyclaceae bacterium]